MATWSQYVRRYDTFRDPFFSNILLSNLISFNFSPECGRAQLRLPLFVSLSWSTSMTSIIFLFKLVHLNDLLFNEKVHDVVEEVNVKEDLKSSIFDVQKAAAPKNIVEFRQSSIGTIRSSLATSYDVSRRRARSPNFDQSEVEKLSQTDRQIHRESTYCQALLYEQSLQKQGVYLQSTML